MPKTSYAIKPDTYVAKYVPLGYRTPSPDEQSIRGTAQDLKIAAEEAIQIAARAMAALIDGPCWLVPVPASNGSLTANLALARAIAELVPGARVKCAVGRAHPVESSNERRLRGLHGLTVEQHAIIRTAGPMRLLPAYFVDNVITTGTTVAACRRALGWGTGLTYADASTPHNNHRLNDSPDLQDQNENAAGPFGPVIYAYTRSQAVADGFQIEVTKIAAEAGIKFPVFLTRMVFDQFVIVPPGVTGQDEAGRLWDIVWLLRLAIRRARPGTDRLSFALYVRNDNRGARLVKLIATCGPRSTLLTAQHK
jgi:hypothetical protein